MRGCGLECGAGTTDAKTAPLPTRARPRLLIRGLWGARPCRPRVRERTSDPTIKPAVLKVVPWAFGRNRACGPIAVRGPLLNEPNCPDPVAQTVEDILWEISVTACRQNPCINRFAWASALPQMPSPCDRPERCPNSRRVRVPDTQMHELRPRLWRPNPHRSSEGRCSGLDRQRVGGPAQRRAQVRAGRRVTWIPLQATGNISGTVNRPAPGAGSQSTG